MRPWLLVLALVCFVMDPLAHLAGGDHVCKWGLGLVAAFLVRVASRVIARRYAGPGPAQVR